MKIQNRIDVSNLADALRIAKRRKWLIVIPLVLVTTAVIIGSQFLSPVYESASIILLDRDIRLTNELQGMLGVNRNAYRSEDALMEELRSYRNILTSSSFMLELADRLKLEDNREIRAKVDRMAAALPAASRVQAFAYVLQTEIGSSIAVKSAGADQVLITVESNSATMAQDITRVLGELFVKELLKQDVSSARSSQNFADAQFEKYEQLLRSKINEKTNFERTLIQNRPDTGVISENNRGKIKSEIEQISQDIKENQSTERQLLSRLNGLGDRRLAIAELNLKDSPALRQDKDQLKSSLQSYGDFLQQVPYNDPQMLNYRLRENTLLSSIITESERVVNSQFSFASSDVRQTLSQLFGIRMTLDYLVLKNQYVTAARDQIENKINRIPESQATLDRLNREITSITALRDKFKNQQEGSTISQALLEDLSTTKYRILEPATLPLEPIRPNKVKLSIMGFVLSIVMGISATILAEFADSSYKKPQDLEDDLNVSVLGVAPRIEALSLLKKSIARAK